MVDQVRTYRSKIGAELVVPVSLVLGTVSYAMAYHRIWPGLALMFLIAAFIAHMLLTTYYQVKGSVLKIRCGFFFDRTVPIDAIREVKETRDPSSAPAASLDRLILRYDRFDSVVISPKEKEAFIQHLLNINPGIKLAVKDSP